LVGSQSFNNLVSGLTYLLPKNNCLITIEYKTAMTITDVKEIEIELNQIGEKIAVATFMTLINKDSGYILNFENIKADRAIIIKNKSPLDITFKIGKGHYTSIDVITAHYIVVNTKPDNLFLEISSDSKLYSYNQFELDLIKKWNNGEQLNAWRNLNLEKKRAWIHASSSYVEWGNKEKLRDQIIIDGSLIKYKEDFYCHLGEAFYKSIGYMGRTLDGIDDCLSFFRFPKNHNQTITIYHVDKLKKVLNKKKADYLDIVFEIFEKHGFIIKIECGN